MAVHSDFELPPKKKKTSLQLETKSKFAKRVPWLMSEADVSEIALACARQIRAAWENELTPLLRRYLVEMLPALDVHKLTQKKNVPLLVYFL